MNNVQSRPTFTSTIIPNQPLENLYKYTDKLDKYFDVKGIIGTTEKIRNSINLGQAGVGVRKEGLIVVGKDKSADNFIHRILKEVDRNVKYIDDAPAEKISHDTIDFII